MTGGSAVASADETQPGVAGRQQLAEELRQLARLAVAGRIDDAVAAAAAQELARIRHGISAPTGWTPWWWAEAGDPHGGWERFNPVAPPLDLVFDGSAVRGSVQLGVEFTGPPGVAHGGTVATILDHALGIHLSRIHRPSFTATLHVRYLAPTPIGATLEVVATHAAIDGPRTRAWAELRHEGRTTARAEGRFRLVPPKVPQDGSST